VNLPSRAGQTVCRLASRPLLRSLARLFVGLVLAAVRAELLQLEPVGIVAAVLLGDVVAVFAHLARQSDLWPYVCTGRHVSCPLSEMSVLSCSDGRTRTGDLTIMSRSL